MQQIEEKNQAKSQPGFEPAPTNTTSLWLTTSTARLSHPDGPSGRANITNERPDNPTGIFRNPVDFVRMASGRGLKISPKSSGWASGFPTYYRGSYIIGRSVKLVELFNFTDSHWVQVYEQAARRSFEEELELYE